MKLITAEECVAKLKDLFNEYSEYFGLGDDEATCLQCYYEDEFRSIMCEHEGHNLGPDHCGLPEHDLCYSCNRAASDLGYERDPTGGYREKP